MAVKDIPTEMVLHCAELPGSVVRLLIKKTGQPAKVVERAVEREVKRGYLEYGCSLWNAWPTPKGRAFLTEVVRSKAK